MSKKKQTPDVKIYVDLHQRKMMMDKKEITVYSVDGYNIREDMNTHGVFTTKEKALEEAMKLIK